MSWEEHVYFWKSRLDRVDYFIIYEDRPIGHLAIKNVNDDTPEISILIGELSLWGRGIASVAITELIKINKNRYTGLKAVINSNNTPSIELFKKKGFKYKGLLSNNDEWLEYFIIFDENKF